MKSNFIKNLSIDSKLSQSSVFNIEFYEGVNIIKSDYFSRDALLEILLQALSQLGYPIPYRWSSNSFTMPIGIIASAKLADDTVVAFVPFSKAADANNVLSMNVVSDKEIVSVTKNDLNTSIYEAIVHHHVSYPLKVETEAGVNAVYRFLRLFKYKNIEIQFFDDGVAKAIKSDDSIVKLTDPYRTWVFDIMYTIEKTSPGSIVIVSDEDYQTFGTLGISKRIKHKSNFLKLLERYAEEKELQIIYLTEDRI